jgi:hypothetical protein
VCSIQSAFWNALVKKMRQITLYPAHEETVRLPREEAYNTTVMVFPVQSPKLGEFPI